MQKAVELRPGVISMPGLNGFEFAKCVHERLPDAEILVVTEHYAGTLKHLPSQPRGGGYVVKSQIERDLIPAVEAASKHQTVSTSAVA